MADACANANADWGGHRYQTFNICDDVHRKEKEEEKNYSRNGNFDWFLMRIDSVECDFAWVPFGLYIVICFV